MPSTQALSSVDFDDRLVWLEDAEKRYGRKLVFKIAMLALRRREFVIVAGTNGSGKSTLARVLAGIAPISSGRIQFSQTFAGMRVCYVPQSGGVYPQLTLSENMRAFAYLAGRPVSDRVSDDWDIANLGLQEHWHTKAGELSGGFQKLAAIACGLASAPDVVFLDEPLTGIDPARQHTLKEGLASLAGQLSLLLVTAHRDTDFAAAHRSILIAEGSIQ